jgi:hypothetical protein
LAVPSSLPYVPTSGLGSAVSSPSSTPVAFSPSSAGSGRFASLLPSLSSSLSSLGTTLLPLVHSQQVQIECVRLTSGTAALGGWDSSRYFVVQLPSR